jgi:hypothetical protein
MAVTVKIIFWNVTLCILVEMYHCLREFQYTSIRLQSVTSNIQKMYFDIILKTVLLKIMKVPFCVPSCHLLCKYKN